MLALVTPGRRMYSVGKHSCSATQEVMYAYTLVESAHREIKYELSSLGEINEHLKSSDGLSKVT